MRSVVRRASAELVDMWEVLLKARLLLQQALVPSFLVFVIVIG